LELITKLHTATYIRGSFGQGFRYPSVAELFVTTALGPLGIYPNEKLKPEKGYSAELGIKQGFQFGKEIELGRICRCSWILESIPKHDGVHFWIIW
jgi:hypothetical protein